jgi:hypothetical protein
MKDMEMKHKIEDIVTETMYGPSNKYLKGNRELLAANYLLDMLHVKDLDLIFELATYITNNSELELKDEMIEKIFVKMAEIYDAYRTRSFNI